MQKIIWPTMHKQVRYNPHIHETGKVRHLNYTSQTNRVSFFIICLHKELFNLMQTSRIMQNDRLKWWPAPALYIQTSPEALMEVPNNNNTKQQPTITCLTQTHIVTVSVWHKMNNWQSRFWHKNMFLKVSHESVCVRSCWALLTKP